MQEKFQMNEFAVPKRISINLFVGSHYLLLDKLSVELDE